MKSHQAHEVPYQNQMRFNLNVPLTSQNMVTHFQKPSPVMVERVGGHKAIPAHVHSKQPSHGNPNESVASSFNYSALSEEKMAMISQMAQRDLKNRKLQAQRKGNSPEHHDRNASSPSHVQFQRATSRVKKNEMRSASQKKRPPLRAKEAEKNRRLGAVQTPPRQKAAGDSSFFSVKSEDHEKSDVFFPVNAANLLQDHKAPKNDIGNMMQEIESYLHCIERIEERMLSDGHAKFLHPSVKSKKRDGFLDQLEDLDRGKKRAGEQSTRSARNVYNMLQKLKQLQKSVTHSDLSKPTIKSQIVSQLAVIHRGAVRSLEAFVSQLPYQDLNSGLPAHYKDLALLLRQLTDLNSATKKGEDLVIQDGVIALLDRVDDLNSKWQSRNSHYNSSMQAPPKKSGITKEWVSDTKVDPSHLYKPAQEISYFGGPKITHPPQQKNPASRLGRQMQKKGKENRWGTAARAESKFASHMKPASLVGQSKVGFVPVQKTKERSFASNSVQMKVDKGYLLPPDLLAKREKAQRAVELSKMNYAESTISTHLKTSPSRSSSAPSSPKRRGVTFDQDSKSPAPWIPPGSGTQRPRSASADREQSSFYLREMDSTEMRSMFQGQNSTRVTRKERGEIPEYGFRSLPTDQKSRSPDVSDSFLDRVERRLLYRMLERRAGTYDGIPHHQVTSKLDEAMDITEAEISEIDNTLDTTNEEELVRREAVSIMDAPTLENIKLRLADMQRQQKEIRMRWSTLKFTDEKPKSKVFTSRQVNSYMVQEPAAIKVTSSSVSDKRRNQIDAPANKGWTEDPIMFTQSLKNPSVQHVHDLHGRNRDELQMGRPLTFSTLCPPKQLVTLKQTDVQRIVDDREHFENYLRKRSYHPTGKFNPWNLVEEISDEILMDCLQEVAHEVEQVSEEIANHMYKSEFMVEKSASGVSLNMDDMQTVPTFVAADQFVRTEDTNVKTEKTNFGVRGTDENKAFMEDSMFKGGGDQGLQMSGEFNSQRPSAYGLDEPCLEGGVSQPLLDDVSEFVQRLESKDMEAQGGDHTGDNHKTASELSDDESSEDDEDDDQNEDEDDDYSEDDFEDVSDVEL